MIILSRKPLSKCKKPILKNYQLVYLFILSSIVFSQTIAALAEKPWDFLTISSFSVNVIYTRKNFCFKMIKNSILIAFNINFDEIQVSHKGGRKFNYDFEIKFLQNGNITKTEKIEFKYNASSVEDCPQFASPMKLSQYMDGIPYEEFFYNNYLGSICELFDEPKPGLGDYLKQIHNNKPKCV